MSDEQDLEKIAGRMTQVLSDFLSRCGVPLDSIKYGELRCETAHVTYELQWDYKTTFKDEQLHSPRKNKGEPLLDHKQMDAVTESTAREFAQDKESVQKFAEGLKNRTFKDLIYLCRRINVLNERSVIGSEKCQLCKGKAFSACTHCDGTGLVPCPVCMGHKKECTLCQGEGKIECRECRGNGEQVCSACKGKVMVMVERHLRHEAVGTVLMNLTMNHYDELPPLILSETDKELIRNSTELELSSSTPLAKGHKMIFHGDCKCYRLPIYLGGNQKPFVYTACGGALHPINKPPLLDHLFVGELAVLRETLKPGARHSIEEKIKCCKTLAAKAILSYTLRGMDIVCSEILRAAAREHQVRFEDLNDHKKVISDVRLRSIVLRQRPQMIARIAEILSAHADHFISPNFAHAMATELYEFYPLLDQINPKSKKLWTIISGLTLTVVMVMMLTAPTPATAMMAFILSAVTAVMTSYYLTQNIKFFTAVQSLKLTRNGRRIPDLTPEAISSGRLLLITAVVEAAILWIKT